MSNTILVTGATGTIGSRVVKELAGKPDVAVRVAVRSAEKAKALAAANVTPVDFDYSKPETLEAAVKGVDRIFLLTPVTPDQVALGKRLIDAAKAAGVRHIVKLSALGVEAEPGIQLGRWHRELERYIEASGLAYTFLRPGNFMDNFIKFYPPGPDGNIYLPFGNGAVGWVDGDDIAAVAAAALTSDAHANKAYDLTGPEALTVAQVAGILSEAAGRPVRYVDVPEEAAKKALTDYQMPGWMVDAMMELYSISKAGYTASVTPAVQEILGRPPRSFAEFARDNAAAWKAPG
jgi:uncharacterized protein YbjT (DUF2867 family)